MENVKKKKKEICFLLVSANLNFLKQNFITYDNGFTKNWNSIYKMSNIVENLKCKKKKCWIKNYKCSKKEKVKDKNVKK